ncbi:MULTISPECIES: MerR family transcriptional regulator [Streptomyces]|uniref:MerR family transcriptional regulator n=1 Tax=Streptomyces TaxID=1883 RepID=UPI001F15984A|nr:MerR family transcriptional regulator [Streptomyces sp. NHF165]
MAETGTAGDGVLRSVDLARAAGLSTQQVRNYADMGVLPPAERTPAGYRRFGPRHREALLVHRALARGHGVVAARRIMHAVHTGDVPAALALVDAGHAGLHAEREALEETGAALAALTEQSGEGEGERERRPVRGSLRIGEVAAVLGVRGSALRVWEAAGLIRPPREPVTGHRRYGAAEVRDARVIRMLRLSGYPLPQIRPVLDELRASGGTEALRAALARRRAELTRRTAALLEGGGLLHAYLAAYGGL